MGDIGERWILVVAVQHTISYLFAHLSTVLVNQYPKLLTYTPELVLFYAQLHYCALGRASYIPNLAKCSPVVDVPPIALFLADSCVSVLLVNGRLNTFNHTVSLIPFYT